MPRAQKQILREKLAKNRAGKTNQKEATTHNEENIQNTELMATSSSSITATHRSSGRSFRIAVEGNIAAGVFVCLFFQTHFIFAGKSSFLRILNNEFDYVVVPEPITKVRNFLPDNSGQATTHTVLCSGKELLTMIKKKYLPLRRTGYGTHICKLLISLDGTRTHPPTYIGQPVEYVLRKSVSLGVHFPKLCFS